MHSLMVFITEQGHLLFKFPIRMCTHIFTVLKSAPKNYLRYCILKVEIGANVNHNVL